MNSKKNHPEGLNIIPTEIVFSPIGHVVTSQEKKYQASRQPDERSTQGYIQLYGDQNFEQALTNLEECTHLWIIYQFHKNKSWKPMVTPPRSKSKKGVFATRSPYRPNPIGLSVVKLISIDKLKLFIGDHDLLNETPILDIKPYHPEFDLIKNAKINWLEKETQQEKFKVKFSPLAENQIDFIITKNSKEQKLIDPHMEHFKNFILRQLEYSPLDKKKKRVKSINDINILSYRTWRVHFIIQDKNCVVLSISTGYKELELIDKSIDKYQDKKLHQLFINEFGF